MGSTFKLISSKFKLSVHEIKKQRLKNATRFLMYIFIGLFIESYFF